MNDEYELASDLVDLLIEFIPVPAADLPIGEMKAAVATHLTEVKEGI